MIWSSTVGEFKEVLLYEIYQLYLRSFHITVNLNHQLHTSSSFTMHHTPFAYVNTTPNPLRPYTPPIPTPTTSEEA